MIAQFAVTSSCETLLSDSSVVLSFEKKNKIKNNSTIWTLERENNCVFLSAAASKVNVLFKAVVDVCYPKGNESVTFSFCSTRWWKRGGVSFIFHTGVSWKDQKCTLDGESKGSAQSPALPLWPSATKADPCYFASRLSGALCQQPTFFVFLKNSAFRSIILHLSPFLLFVWDDGGRQSFGRERCRTSADWNSGPKICSRRVFNLKSL